MKETISICILGIGILLVTGCQWIQQPTPIVKEPVSVTPGPPSVVHPPLPGPANGGITRVPTGSSKGIKIQPEP